MRARNSFLALLTMALTLSGLLVYGSSVQAGDTCASAGRMTAARLSHTATLLPSGQVLVLGGVNYDDKLGLVDKLAPELYDPGKNSWAQAGSVVTYRHNHTATLLRNGQVLVIGGEPFQEADATAERYDPAKKSSSRVAPMATARSGGHTATLLRDGQALLLGGNGLATAELYNPDKNTWVTVKSMTTDRWAHSTTLLSNGQVLVVGGRSGNDVLATAERYDPTTNSWASAGRMAIGRREHTATLLPNGQVLVVGGWSNIATNITGSLATAELYDPTANSWVSTRTMATAHAEHTATLLPNGQVLVIGGVANIRYLDTLERYDPNTNGWASAGRMATARKGHTATLLPSGQVLVTGGDGSGGFLATAELCAP